MLRLLRLFKVLKPLRVIHRAPGLKLVVQSLLISLKPIGNIVLICICFFLIFGILGVQVRAGNWSTIMGLISIFCSFSRECSTTARDQI